MQRLPASGMVQAVNALLKDHNNLVITAPPGAGKSTLLPLTILEGLPEGSRILMLEPRRIAAREIAARMAWLLDEPVGKTVGYRIRFESKVSRQTRIEVLTEGILARMLIDDPTLEGVAAVIFDEFHERSLASDEALALTRQAQALLREDLRIVIMSATLDTDAVAAALQAPVAEGSGRMYPVEILRPGMEADATNAAELTARIVREAHEKHEGDILAFLPGEADIRRCESLLTGRLGETAIYPLYGLLSQGSQQDAIAPSPPGKRKVVLATSIAETSLTIEGVRIVVDTGLARKPVWDPSSGLSHLETVRISLDRATQRTGRAGRVAPGACYRLWSTATEARMAPVRIPEILEADLSSLVLDAAAWGEPHVEQLPWLTPLPDKAVIAARRLLGNLGAIDGEGRITPHGKSLAALPCHPRIAQLLRTADTPKKLALAADLAALLDEKDPLENENGVGIDLRLKALQEARMRKASGGTWGRILRGAKQYAKLAGGLSEPDGNAGGIDPYEAGALLAAAYPERIGRAWKEGAGRYQLAGGEIVAMDPDDPVCGSEWIAVAHMHERPGGVGRIFLAGPVAPEDLLPYAHSREVLAWDTREGAVVAKKESRIGNLVLASTPLPGISLEDRVRIISEAAPKEGLSLFDFSDVVENLQRRIAAVAFWHPELELPDSGTTALLASASDWLPAFIGTARTKAQLHKINLEEVIWSRLDYPQRQAVERLAPSHIEVPTGSRIRLEYRQGAEAPVLRVRLQECFGLRESPKVNDGRIPVLMELLSPGYKPVQLTSDLASFWKGTYFEVRKELRRRYPKHAWPDDPLSAEAVRGVRRR